MARGRVGRIGEIRRRSLVRRTARARSFQPANEKPGRQDDAGAAGGWSGGWSAQNGDDAPAHQAHELRADVSQTVHDRGTSDDEPMTWPCHATSVDPCQVPHAAVTSGRALIFKVRVAATPLPRSAGSGGIKRNDTGRNHRIVKASDRQGSRCPMVRFLLPSRTKKPEPSAAA